MNLKRIHFFKGLFLFLPMLFLAQFGNAQKESESVEKYRVVYDYQAPEFQDSGQGNNATVVMQPKVSKDSMGVYYNYDNALAKMIDLHKRVNSSMVEGKGFRIQIYAGSKMDVASGAKTDFLRTFRDSGMEVYKDWNPPHFWVRVGDFLSRNEAMRQLASVKTYFPDAFIVADKIYLPKYKKSSTSSNTEHKELESNRPD